jgi:probable rRNA maturation factor
MSQLRLLWNNEQEAVQISETWIAKLKELLALVGETEGVDGGEIALTFVDDERIHELNKMYRGIDRPTDVLSFSMLEMGEDEQAILYEDEYEVEESDDESTDPNGDKESEDTDIDDEADEDLFVEPLGDIIISVQTAAAQAEEYGHSIEREIGFLFVHGFLHVIGYDHEDEGAEKAMFAKQEAILLKAGLTR